MEPGLIAQVLAGVIAVPILQVLKRYLKTADVPMAWISFAVAFIIATITALVTGQVHLSLAANDPVAFFSELGKSAGVVFGTATLVYRTLKDKLK